MGKLLRFGIILAVGLAAEFWQVPFLHKLVHAQTTGSPAAYARDGLLVIFGLILARWVLKDKNVIRR